MSDVSSPDAERTVRVGWLKAMYGANIGVSAPIGAAVLLAPDAFRAVMGIPPQSPIYFGMASGAVPLAFGLAGLWGLRAPVKASPVLLLQLCYKGLFLGAVVFPLVVTGQFPSHAVPLVVIFIFFIVGDAIALPFRYLFREPALG